MVLTIEGSNAIEEIQAGDLVYSTDPETGESEYKEVVRAFRKESDVIIHIFVNGEEIETTPNHPFWVENQWVLAKDLREGDVLTLADGTTAAITRTYGEQLDEPVIVYNFEVKDFHTYYVTDTGVLVHNDACGINDNYGKDYEDLEDYRKSLGLPVAGSVNDVYTTAKLKIGNSEYYGVNGHGMHNEVKNTFNVNAQTATHAEADVFYQAKLSGESSTSAILVTDRRACRSCGLCGGIRSMARQMGIIDLTIVSPGYKAIQFNPQVKPTPNPFL